MRRFTPLLLALACLCAWPALVRAATTGSDALSQCLIRSTTSADQKVVVRWAFATMALDPDVASMATVTASRREAINKQAGALVTRLLTQSCSGPVQQTLTTEGVSGITGAFEAWGQWALSGVATEPHVARGMSELLQYIDIGKLMTMMPLLPPPPASSPAPPRTP